MGSSGGGGGGGGSRGPRRFRDAPEGATSTSLYEVFEKPPNFHMLDTEEEVAERKLIETMLTISAGRRPT